MTNTPLKACYGSGFILAGYLCDISYEDLDYAVLNGTNKKTPEGVFRRTGVSMRQLFQMPAHIDTFLIPDAYQGNFYLRFPLPHRF